MNVTILGQQSPFTVIWIGTGSIAIADIITSYNFGWVGKLAGVAFAVLTLASLMIVLQNTPT